MQDKRFTKKNFFNAQNAKKFYFCAKIFKPFSAYLALLKMKTFKLVGVAGKTRSLLYRAKRSDKWLTI